MLTTVNPVQAVKYYSDNDTTCYDYDVDIIGKDYNMNDVHPFDLALALHYIAYQENEIKAQELDTELELTVRPSSDIDLNSADYEQVNEIVEFLTDSDNLIQDEYFTLNLDTGVFTTNL